MFTTGKLYVPDASPSASQIRSGEACSIYIYIALSSIPSLPVDNQSSPYTSGLECFNYTFLAITVG